MSPATENGKELKFEAAIERLEKIVEEMEGGELPLEKTMEHFEEGMGLVRACTEKLNEVERKIELLVEKDGELTTEPFEAGEDDNGT